jgi:hypothetical protein
MKFNEVESTWIKQLGMPENRKVLEEFKARKAKSPEELIRYYRFIIKALEGTPAWGVSGVNKMINELTDAVRATINHAKRGKSSAPAHTNKLLSIIDFYHNEEAVSRYCGNYKLRPLLSIEELQSFLAVA